MALLTRKGIYGLIALEQIATASQIAPMSISDISEKTGISKGYLEQILNALRDARFICSIKGKNGGFYLAQRLDEIKFVDVFEVLEKDFKVSNLDIKNPFIKAYIQEQNLKLHELFNRPISDFLKFKEESVETLNYSI